VTTIRVLTADPYFRVQRCPLRFTLTYEGVLRTSQKGRNQQRPELRKHFHKQLLRLWDVNTYLANWTIGNRYTAIPARDWVQSVVPVVNGIKFVPLVFSALAVECAVEFRILRSTERNGNVADADNQIKALLDALKMPQDSTQIGEKDQYLDYDPLFTLTQDDKLITKIVAVSDEMLAPPAGWSKFDSKLCRIQIDVSVRPYLPTSDNVIFFDDDKQVWDSQYDAAIPNGLASMTNHQLKATATQLIFRIRALATSLETNAAIRFDPSVGPAGAIQKHQLMRENLKEIWENKFWPKAFPVYEELCRRVYGEAPYPTQSFEEIAITHRALAGVSPIADSAAVLQKLLMRLS